MKNLRLILSFILFLNLCFRAEAWETKQAPLMTDYAASVTPENALPEYPRPQLVRSDWMNLNGIWQFQVGTSKTQELPDAGWDKEILVPFCVESALSGIMEEGHSYVWYKRSFTIPEAWNGKEIILHFGSVDWMSEVFVNGVSVGTHRGGYDPFSYNITSRLKTGTNEVVVRVYDPTDDNVADGNQPLGKQRRTLRGIYYTPVTGIWQTVWLEPIAQAHIERLVIVPDIDAAQLNLKVVTENALAGAQATVVIKAGNNTIATKTINVNADVSIDIPNMKLWSPDDPFLYDMEVSLQNNGTQTDKVNSYFGMRKISKARIDGGRQRPMLNNEYVFQFGPLDQGYWPDGLYTIPTEQAMIDELQTIKDLGFNMVRKHGKVEPARWYYHCDRMGLLVWQDMVSPASSENVNKSQFEVELRAMLKEFQPFPSIVLWTMFNESWGQFDTERITNLAMELDPYRLVACASGWNDFEVGHIKDGHSYPAPWCDKNTTRIAVCGEYGGTSLSIEGHTWRADEGVYQTVQNKKELTEVINSFTDRIFHLSTSIDMSAAVYTQIVDVEGEMNGILTYDRKVSKDIGTMAEHFQSVIKYSPLKYTWEAILPNSKDKSASEAQSWQYTFNEPAANWYASAFDDSSWQTGKAPFGNESKANTTWSRDASGPEKIWARQVFNPGELTQEMLDNLFLILDASKLMTVYLNGEEIMTERYLDNAEGWEYHPSVFPKSLRSVLKSNQNNVIAIVANKGGWRNFADCGIYYAKVTGKIDMADDPLPEQEKFPVTIKIVDKTKGEKTNGSGAYNEKNIAVWAGNLSGTAIYEGDWWYALYTDSSFPEGKLTKNEEDWTWQATFYVYPGDYKWNSVIRNQNNANFRDAGWVQYEDFFSGSPDMPFSVNQFGQVDGYVGVELDAAGGQLIREEAEPGEYINIINPDFEQALSVGWTVIDPDKAVKLAGDQVNPITGTSPNSVLNTWSANAYSFDVYQNLTGLQEGIYVFSAYSTSSGDDFFIYANDRQQKLPESGTGTGYQFEKSSVQLTVNDGNLRIGIRGDVPGGAWVNVDEPTLEFYPKGTVNISDVGVYSQNALIISGKGTIVLKTQENHRVNIYAVDGTKIYGNTVSPGINYISLNQGIYIIKVGDQTYKAFVR